jgi:hypothetical protein
MASREDEVTLATQIDMLMADLAELCERLRRFLEAY